MNETVEYRIGRPDERAEIIDFANYVFSQAHRPHDFKTLLPKTYADDAPDFSSWHYLALQDDRIRALVSCRPTDLYLGNVKLSCGCVGTVGVHPYARGEGHMKRLMALMLEDSRKRGYDMLFLGGQRQRYEYFGFESACMCAEYTMTASSVRHALADVDDSGVVFTEITRDMKRELSFAWELANKQTLHGGRPKEEFLNIMHSWNSKFFLITIDGTWSGYVMGNVGELVLTDENLLPSVIKALMRNSANNRICIPVALHETKRMKLLEKICDYRGFGMGEMVNVLNWKNTLSALLSFKASFIRLNDMTAELDIDGEKMKIEVKDGIPAVSEDGEGTIKLTHIEAEQLMFGFERTLLPDARFGNVLPLPLYIGSADTY